ncbi:hypothetical protein FQZ97_744600 [compost metagenome]
MAADLVAGLDHGADRLGMTLGSHGHGEDGHRDVMALEQIEQTPHTDAAAVFVQGFHAHVAHALQWLGGHHLGQEGFGFLVAMEHVAFAAFLIVQHKGQGDAGLTGPVRVWRGVAVTDQVAWVLSAHCSLPSFQLDDQRQPGKWCATVDGVIVYKLSCVL